MDKSVWPLCNPMKSIKRIPTHNIRATVKWILPLCWYNTLALLHSAHWSTSFCHSHTINSISDLLVFYCITDAPPSAASVPSPPSSPFFSSSFFLNSIQLWPMTQFHNITPPVPTSISESWFLIPFSLTCLPLSLGLYVVRGKGLPSNSMSLFGGRRHGKKWGKG